MPGGTDPISALIEFFEGPFNPPPPQINPVWGFWLPLVGFTILLTVPWLVGLYTIFKWIF